MKIWKYENMEIWKYANVEIYSSLGRAGMIGGAPISTLAIAPRLEGLGGGGLLRRNTPGTGMAGTGTAARGIRGKTSKHENNQILLFSIYSQEISLPNPQQ